MLVRYKFGRQALDGWPVNTVYDLWSETVVPEVANRHCSLNLSLGSPISLVTMWPVYGGADDSDLLVTHRNGANHSTAHLK